LPGGKMDYPWAPDLFVATLSSDEGWWLRLGGSGTDGLNYLLSNNYGDPWRATC
jgi:hypothetical protein